MASSSATPWIAGAWAFSIIAAACAAFSEAPSQGDADAGTDAPANDAPGPDRPSVDGGARCNPDAPFGTPQLVSGVPENVADFRSTADESRAYYSNATKRLFFAERIDETSFGPGVPNALESGVLAPSLSDDEATLYFEEFFTVWQARRGDGGAYGNVTVVANNFGQPYFDEKHGRLFAAHYTPVGFFDREIMSAPVDGGAVGAFQLVELGEESSFAPVVGSDGKTVYFASTRAGGMGSDDIFVGDMLADAAPRRLEGVQSNDADLPTWLSRDGCLLYLASARDVPQGYGTKIYLARRGF